MGHVCIGNNLKGVDTTSGMNLERPNVERLQRGGDRLGECCLLRGQQVTAACQMGRSAVDITYLCLEQRYQNSEVKSTNDP